MPRKKRKAAHKEAHDPKVPIKSKRQDTEKPVSNKSKRTRSAAIWTAVILGLIVVVWGMLEITRRPEPESTQLADQNFADNWVKGDPSAKITLVEYSDFQCTACARYYLITKRLADELGSDVQMIFRHFPIITKHANSVLAAKSAEAAGLQGKFWEMHDLLFEKQKAWSEMKKEDARTVFVRYAISLNLDVQKFKNDLDAKEVADKVYEDARTGRSAGVKNTPTFFLNGKKIINKPYSYGTFKDLILKTKQDLS